MKIFLIIILLCCTGCVYPADVRDKRIISVTSETNVLSKVYGPYFQTYQDQDIGSVVKQYSTGELQMLHLKNQKFLDMRREENRYKHTDNYFYYDEDFRAEPCSIWLIPPLLGAFCDVKLPEMYMLLVFNNDKNCYAIVSSEENDADELESTADINFIKKSVLKGKSGVTLEITVENGELCQTQ